MTAKSMAERLERVRERMARAAERSGRSPDEVILVAVTKTHPVSVVRQAYDLGVRHFGENRPEEALPKIEALASELAEAGLSTPHWHMIGHIQHRKVKLVVGHYDLIHSVDTVKLARRLDSRFGEARMRQPVLLEVNVGGEESKFGFAPESLPAAVEAILPMENLELQGLMTVAPIVDDPEEVRPVFRRLRELLDDLRRRFPEAPWQHLSMGMTDDFEVAIEEGSTIVRIGRAIFGPREAL
jgi:pyridoxal phosphate enzyme (YggS family)